MWMRHQDALARAIAADIGAPADDPHCGALARFALEARNLGHADDAPLRAVDAAFDLLEHGWNPARPAPVDPLSRLDTAEPG